MKKHAILFLLALLLMAGETPLWAQAVGVTPVEGRVTQEGKPLAGIQVMLTNLDNSRTFKTKTDNNGGFVVVSVPFGNYQVDITGDKGEKLFTEKTAIGAGDTATSPLKIEVPKGGASADDKSATNSTPAPKLTKQELARIKAANEKIASLNSLIMEAENARLAQDWQKAENLLKQLLAAAPDTTRWEFYLALGDAQSKLNKPEDAVKTFDKGVQIAQSVISGTTPGDPKTPSSSPAVATPGASRMLTAQASAYVKLNKQEEAIASLKKASALEPSSSLAQYNLCGLAYNAGQYADAKPACEKYLQLEPGGPHADEVKAFTAQMGQK